MGKKSGIIFGIILFLLLIGGVIFIISSQKNENILSDSKEQQDSGIVSTDRDIPEKVEDFMVTPIVDIGLEEENDVNEEENDVNEEEKEERISLSQIIEEEKMKILTFSNIKQCDTLKYLKTNCQDGFYYKLAIASNNSDYCGNIKGSGKVGCYDEVYLNTKKCDLIKDSYVKEMCNESIKIEKEKQEMKKQVANIEKTSISIQEKIDICKKQDGYSIQEGCISKVILSEKDLSLCDKIFTNEDEKNSCKVNVGYTLNRSIIEEAFEKKDLSLCDKLTDKNLISQCKSMNF